MREMTRTGGWVGVGCGCSEPRRDESLRGLNGLLVSETGPLIPSPGNESLGVVENEKTNGTLKEGRE